MGKPRRSGGRRRCRHHDVDGIRARVVIEVGQREAAGGPATGTAQLRTVLVCDLADSTALVEKLGDRRAAELMRRHDRIARDLLNEHGGSEIDKTDGFLVLFERPLHAVGFALAYQRALRELEGAAGRPLRARVGIHVGEVQVWDNAAEDIALGAKRVEVEGLAKPVAARLMSVALPGQVLLSGIAFTLAQRAQDELGEVAPRVRWLTHGRYQFKGVPQPMLVHEAGEAGIAPLAPPPSGSKVRREVPWYRTPVALSVEMLVALGIMVTGLFAVLRPDPAIAFAERDWVVVGDLRNLTSEPLFDDALDAAFRIGLEQSRYVNVLPKLQVVDVLKRMERDPSLPVDRDTAVEVALREGARAVIVPTITEVGGRVRISAEVIDPNSGVTVYGESADGNGAEAALPAMDQVLRSLRGRLGESLTAIEQGAEPLARITTGSLDALRAFALAEQKLGQGAVRESMALLEQAVGIDPAFAMAHSRIATIRHATGDDVGAHEAASRALQQVDKLSTRERLMLEGVMAFFAAPGEAQERWATLLSVYPDIAVAENNIGLACLWIENDFECAAERFRNFAQSTSRFRGYGWFGLSVAQTGMGRFDEALDSMERGESFGLRPPSFENVLAPFAQQRHADARALLEAENDSWGPGDHLERALRLAAVALDRADADGAVAELQRASAGLSDALPVAGRQRLAMNKALVQVLAGQPAARASLAAFLRAERQRLADAQARFDRSAALHLSLLAPIAAAHGEEAAAREALAAVRPHLAGESAPHIDALWRAAACAVGEPGEGLAQRISCLEALPDRHGGYVQTHAALLRLSRAADDTVRIDREVAWLLAHRGQALVEMQKMEPQLANIAALNEAALLAAERAVTTDPSRAHDLLADLDLRWVESRRPDDWPGRLAALRALLDEQDD